MIIVLKLTKFLRDVSAVLSVGNSLKTCAVFIIGFKIESRFIWEIMAKYRLGFNLVNTFAIHMFLKIVEAVFINYFSCYRRHYDKGSFGPGI